MLFKVHNQELACCSALLDTFDAAFASVQPWKGREEVNVRIMHTRAIVFLFFSMSRSRTGIHVSKLQKP